MVRLSRYTHTFELDDAVALYHSLRMKPVYLNRKSYEDLQAWLAGPSWFARHGRALTGESPEHA